MTSTRRLRLAWHIAAIVLVSVLAAHETELAVARLSVVWREFVLSFDKPETVWEDEAASDSSLYSDAGREALDAVTIGVQTDRLGLGRHCPPRAYHRFECWLTRSPPSI